MQKYKAPDNSVHCIEPEFEHLLPAGSVAITEEEAEALRPVPDSRAAAMAKIAELEQVQIKETARFIREKTLKEAEDLALSEFGIDPPTLYAMGVGDGAPPPAVAYRKLKDIDNAIKVERNKL